MSGLPAERRGDPRFAIDLPVRLVLGPDLTHIEAILIDVSRGGLYVETAARASLGRPVQVSFRCRSATCEATGNVIRHHAGDGFAVQCREANRAFLDFLQELAAARPEQRADVLAAVDSPEIQVG